MQQTVYSNWLKRFDQRLEIRRRVMEALGIRVPRRISTETREMLRRTMINCATCENVKSCLDWLERADFSAGSSAFCANRDLFGSMSPAPG